MTKLRDSRVLVTGAASGLGRRLALGIARRGGRLTLWDLDGERLSGVADEARALGASAETFVCDVSDRRAVYETAAALEEPLDVLINNAGIVSGAPFLELEDDAIERSFAVNALALFWTTKAILPRMIERDGGHLVTIASAGGLIGVSRLTDYSATKFAAFGFDESLRAELRKRGSRVRTTVVCPYFVNTGMFEGARTRFSWLLPILDEAKVAEKILKAIESNRRLLFMPKLVYSLPLLRLLPVSWFDAIADLMGIHATMDGFTGRNRKP